LSDSSSSVSFTFGFESGLYPEPKKLELPTWPSNIFDTLQDVINVPTVKVLGEDVNTTYDYFYKLLPADSDELIIVARTDSLNTSFRSSRMGN